MNSLTCLVCGGAADCSHFGANSCRACAAFFRRKVVECRELRQRCDGKCKVETRRRNVCQKCRFEKCLEVGMRMTAVYGRLEKSRAPNPLEHVLRSEVPQFLGRVQEVYLKLEHIRKVTFQVRENHIPQLFDYKQMNTVLKTDTRIMTSTMGSFFDSMTNVSECQKKLLLNNFLIKFYFLDCGFKSGGKYVLHLANGNFMDYENMRHFYWNPEDQRLAQGSLRIMEPYWDTMGRTIIAQLAELQLDFQEFLFLTAILYWDQSVPDISEESMEVCRQMRNQVLRELTAYEKSIETSRDHSLRVGDLILLLKTVQLVIDLMEESKEMLSMNGMDEVHEAMFEALTI